MQRPRCLEGHVSQPQQQVWIGCRGCVSVNLMLICLEKILRADRHCCQASRWPEAPTIAAQLRTSIAPI